MVLTEHSRAIGNLAEALATVQAELRPAAKDVQGQIGQAKYKYADLGSVWSAIQPALGAAGIAVVQTVEHIDGDDYLATTVAHKSGEYLRGRCPIHVAEEHKGTTAAQAYGSAMTYARRYGLSAMLGIVTEDDDGAKAGTGQRKQKAPASSSAVTMNADEIRRFQLAASEQHQRLGSEVFESVLAQMSTTGEQLATLVDRGRAGKIIVSLKAHAAEDKAIEADVAAEMTGSKRKPLLNAESMNKAELCSYLVVLQNDHGLSRGWVNACRQRHEIGDVAEDAGKTMLVKYAVALEEAIESQRRGDDDQDELPL